MPEAWGRDPMAGGPEEGGATAALLRQLIDEIKDLKKTVTRTVDQQHDTASQVAQMRTSHDEQWKRVLDFWERDWASMRKTIDRLRDRIEKLEHQDIRGEQVPDTLVRLKERIGSLERLRIQAITAVAVVSFLASFLWSWLLETFPRLKP